MNTCFTLFTCNVLICLLSYMKQPITSCMLCKSFFNTCWSSFNPTLEFTLINCENEHFTIKLDVNDVDEFRQNKIS